VRADIVLVLSDKDIIGEGGKRTVYRHPEDHKKCIKVVNYDKLEQKINKRKKYRLIKITKPIKYYDKSHEEIHNLEKLKKRNIKDAFEYMPMFYGTIETNKGMGSVFDFIEGENLETYLENNKFTPEIEEELNKIRDNFVKNKLHFSDCRAENFVIQKNKDKIKIYAIDGFEHNELIPITKISFFSKQKVKRIFERFINHITKN
jgi:hypothetical protein